MTTVDTRSEVAEPDVRPPEAEPLPEPGHRVADHKALGTAYLVAALAFLVLGGVLALVMRTQLLAPDLELVGSGAYRELTSLHGTISVFFFLLPAWAGVATAVVPLQIGASRLAFPRVNALALALFVAGGVLVLASPLAGGAGPRSGWTLSLPVPERPVVLGQGSDLLILGVALAGVAVVAVAVNLLVTLVKLRAPGMTPLRTPLFSWSVLVSAGILLLVTPVLVAGLVMLLVDRHWGGQIFRGFTGSGGGNRLLWPRLFWFFAYPALWALVISALGIVSEIVATFTRRALVGPRLVRGALSAVGILSFAGWGSEVTNLPERLRPLFGLGALAVLAPAGLVVLVWLATLRAARAAGEGPRRGDGPASASAPASPMLHALGCLTVLGLGLAAAFVSALNSGGALHARQWAVGHQHLLYFGVPLVALAGAVYYWGPKLWGWRLGEGLGRLQALVLVTGVHLTALPLLVLGLQGMPLHRSTYSSARGWQPANLAATAGACLVALGVLMLVLNVLAGRARREQLAAGDNPWGGQTLEWATTSPPPAHNFDRLPEIRSDRPVSDLAARPGEAGR